MLNSLATVKSVVLLTDIPAADQLTTILFTTFFDIMANSHRSSTGEQLGKTVEINMTVILGIMVDESPNLPQDVIDIIVAQFLRIDPQVMTGAGGKGKKNVATDDKQSTFTLKELPPSYNMAKTVCNSAPEKMAKYISQYFNDVVVDASSSSSAPKFPGKKSSHRRISDELDEEELDLGGGPTEDDMKDLRKVHQLLRELWRACPAVLQNVIPQLEAELSAENVHLRSLATETLGDIISGIGSAGLPPSSQLNPAAYPAIALSDQTDSSLTQNVLTKPSSPQPIPQAHPKAYASFLSRCNDKSAHIRSIWTTAIGRILTTSAGGVGLSQQEEEHLIGEIARMLGDADEKVRMAAVRAVGTFSFRDAVHKLGSSGGISQSGSVLGNLTERVRDRKHSVRAEAMVVLARLWGVAEGAIADREEEVISAFGAAPSKILDTYYTNDVDINSLLDQVLFEQLLPLNYPPIKIKGAKLTNGASQTTKDGQTGTDQDSDHIDPDKIRTERILVLARDLDERAKKVFFAVQQRQLLLAKVLDAFLLRCADYNGGVVEGNEKQIKENMSRLIEILAKTLPDPSKVTEHLWKFAKMHDKRSYTLIRFCMGHELQGGETRTSDYRTVIKAMKEFNKRVAESASAPSDLLNTMTPLLYRVSAIVYNKSHIPAIMEYARTDEKGLAATAHEMLKEISTRIPEILKAHVQDLCMALQNEAPTSTKANPPSSVDNLKACASFAAKFADEIPKDRKFLQAMTSFALYGTPANAAKHAVTVLMKASDKKELLAKDLVRKCVKDFEYGENGFLSRLAALSQLMLLAPEQTNEEADAISDITIEQILLQSRIPAEKAADAYDWTRDVDAECEAKCWSLKFLVNRVRSNVEPETLSETANPVYKLLVKLITQNGEMTPSNDTPSNYKPRLRLLAARQCLKLCLRKPTDALLSAEAFNSLSLVAQDPLREVRSSFLQRLKKYLSQQKLPQRFYTIPFLLAFEPSQSLRSDTTTWIRSRSALFTAARTEQGSKAPPVMESVFARLVSLLAHHPDYAANAEDLVDFARYLVFYLQAVATADNVSLIYDIAQRVKQCRDAIMPSFTIDENLYHLSDLAQLTIRKFEEIHAWNIQTLPGRITLPKSLYTEIKEHVSAQRIAEKNYLPEAVDDGVEALVKQSMRAARAAGTKRRSDSELNGGHRGGKKAKPSNVRKGNSNKDKKSDRAPTKTPKKTKSRQSDPSEVPTTERRRSGRAAAASSGKYTERDDDDDDEEMADGVAEWRYENEEGGQEIAANGHGAHGDDEEEDEVEDQFDVPTSPPKPSPKGKKANTPASAVSKATKKRKAR